MGEIEVLSRTQRIIVEEHVVRIVVDQVRPIKIFNSNMIGPPGFPGPEGPDGPQGPQGPQGPTGADGAPATYAFIFDQGSPENLWHVVHNLGFYPTVTVVDSGGNEVEGHIIYNSINDLDVSFTLPFGGKAFLS